MPGKNVVKVYASEQYYHVYSRGVAKQPVFHDAQDYGYFISLLKRYLSNEPAISKARVKYPWYGQRLELLAFCLMPNHIHLLVYQHDEKAMPELLRSLMTSYSMYFNKRYDRVGPVFQGRYRASRIASDNYLDHISRYIHLNPKDWRKYEYSSLRYYTDNASAEWIKPARIMILFRNRKEYHRFVSDYEGNKQMLDEIKWDLANNP